MKSKLFLGEGFLTIQDMKANGFDTHTANAVENLTRQKLYAKYGDQSPSPEIHAGFRWIAARELGIITEGKGKTKTRLDPKCWKGYKKQGTKMKGGVRVNNCVPESEYSLSSAKQYIREWGEDHEDGASQEEVANAIANRFMHNTDLMKQALEKAGGVEGLMASIDDVAEFHTGALELGSSDVSIMVREVLHGLGIKERSEVELDEASGDFAEPIYDLIEELGDSSIVLENLIMYLDGDTIRDFVDDFRRMHDMNEGFASDEQRKAAFANGYKPKKKTDERKLTGGEKRSKEANFKKLKKHKGDFEKRYGKDAESVMHAVATKRAKGESVEKDAYNKMQAAHDNIYPKKQAIKWKVKPPEGTKNIHPDSPYLKKKEVEEGRLGFSDIEKLGRDAASRIDNEARRRGSANMSPGDADQLRYKVAKEMGLVEGLKKDPKLPNLKVSDGKTDYEKKKYASVTAKKNESAKNVKEDTMDALKGKFNSGPSDEMLRKRSEPWEEKVRADMEAGKDAGWFLDRKQGAGQKWSIGTKTWFDVEKYQKKRGGIGSRLKRMVGMESMIREYAEAGYFTK